MRIQQELIDYAEASISVAREEIIENGKLEVAMYALAQHKNKQYSIIGFGDPFGMIAQMGHDAFRDQFLDSLAEDSKKEKFINVGVVSLVKNNESNATGSDTARVVVESKAGLSAEVQFEFHIFENRLLLGRPKLRDHTMRIFK